MDLITRKFEAIGARAHVRSGAQLRIDITTDRRGEVFELLVPEDHEVEVLDLRPKDRHLLLLARSDDKQRFLCGHDERHWFAAAIPERAAVSTVGQAKDALKPAEVREAERAVRVKLRNRRRNPAYLRQGEWFFIPVPGLVVEDSMIRRNEPLSRGRGSKPHMADEVSHLNGELVYVSRAHPEGLTRAEYKELVRRNRGARAWPWRTMIRGATVFARGRIAHPDHATVVLRGWHEVHMNTENESRAHQHLAFLD